MSAAWQVMREIPLLVWLAILVAVAWLRHQMVERFGGYAEEPGSEIAVPSPKTEPRHTGYVVNLITGEYRKISFDE